MKEKKIIVLGAGLAGLSSAYFLKEKNIESAVFEKADVCGGLCKSIKKDGYTFDCAGHLLHFRSSESLSFVKKLLGDNLLKHNRNAQVYSFNKLIPYPFQSNLHHLPDRIAKECTETFLEASNNNKGDSSNQNFLDWLNKKFGAGVTRNFMIPYNEKFWNVPLDKLISIWADRFVVVPSIRSMDKSYNLSCQENLGYNAVFWYPQDGGIQELIKAFIHKKNNIYLNYEAECIDLKEKTVKFKNGVKKKYDVLINTLPLPKLAKIIKDVPGDVLSEFKKLRWISIYNVNFGIKGKVVPKCHWIYFPQKNISFFRVGFFHNFSATMAGSGKNSLYTEVSYSENAPLNGKKNISKIVDDLIDVNIIPNREIIETYLVNDIKYAYPIYDHNYVKANQVITRFLKINSILSAGRFGKWEYLSMEDVISDGKVIAEKVLN
ncbi:MAG: FAD-dependent oxidoreductase [Candidatus Omnitrophica bacterium]|nr:FAD-dependent oxidoreductase [Candidatus Omnitrophota bacterium]